MSPLQLERDWAAGALNTDYEGINIWKVCLELGTWLDFPGTLRQELPFLGLFNTNNSWQRSSCLSKPRWLSHLSFSNLVFLSLRLRLFSPELQASSSPATTVAHGQMSTLATPAQPVILLFCLVADVFAVSVGVLVPFWRLKKPNQLN